MILGPAVPSTHIQFKEVLGGEASAETDKADQTALSVLMIFLLKEGTAASTLKNLLFSPSTLGKALKHPDERSTGFLQWYSTLFHTPKFGVVGVFCVLCMHPGVIQTCNLVAAIFIMRAELIASVCLPCSLSLHWHHVCLPAHEDITSMISPSTSVQHRCFSLMPPFQM